MLKQLRPYPALPGQSPMPLFNTHFRDRDLSQVPVNKEVAVLKPISIISSINTLLSKLCVVRAHYSSSAAAAGSATTAAPGTYLSPITIARISARE